MDNLLLFGNPVEKRLKGAETICAVAYRLPHQAPHQQLVKFSNHVFNWQISIKGSMDGLCLVCGMSGEHDGFKFSDFLLQSTGQTDRQHA